jgi:glycosyltransferase involved in cell wall biosynthesis
VPELVRQGWNGYVCDPLDTAGMARAMATLASPAVDLEAMGAASRELVSLYTPETWALGLADCLQRTLARSQDLAVEETPRWPGFFKTEKQPG